MPYIIALIISLLLMSGCSMGPKFVEEDDIVNYDPERDDIYKRHTGEPYYQPTEPHVVVINQDNVIVEVFNLDPIFDKEAKINLQHWNVYITNRNEKNKCVSVIWRLMDFKLISEFPTEMFVKRHDVVRLGSMIQRVWVIDGVPVAPPASGYVERMQVRDSNNHARPGDECLFLVDEHEVIEK